jgi:hypothetical protein
MNESIDLFNKDISDYFNYLSSNVVHYNSDVDEDCRCWCSICVVKQ